MQKRLMVTLVTILGLFSQYASGQRASTQPVTSQTTLNVSSAIMEPKQILKREAPAIVTVYSVNNAGQAFAMGSGFIVRPNGIVVTNYHVIKGAHDAKIKLKNDEIYQNPLIIDYDKARDLVVLKIRANDLPTVTLGNSAAVEEGDRAYAIGHPENYPYTISEGLISGRRVIEGTELLQISVPISHGSSGGPLYNAYGQVIGITTAGYMEGAQNLNFAVPIKYVPPMLDSQPRNTTLAQLTETDSPALSPEKVVVPGWLEMALPAGWELDSPPEGMMLSIKRNDEGALLAYRSTDSKNADDAFNGARQIISDEYGRLAEYSKKIKVNREGQHARLQTFRSSNASGTLLVVAALQNGNRIIVMVGVCKTSDAYDELLAALETIKW